MSQREYYGRAGYDPQRFLGGISAQFRTLIALVVRDAIVRRRGARFLAIQPFVEPFIWIGGLVAIRIFLLAKPSYGDSVTMFIVLGFIPFYLMVHVATNVTNALMAANTVRQIPIITNLDIALARGLMEGIMILSIAVIGLLGLGFFGFKVVPFYFMQAIVSLLSVFVFALGLGILNGAIAIVIPFWGFAFSVLLRIKLFFSAVLYLPVEMVEPLRTWIMYNPLLHGVEWFRSSFYLQYPTWHLDIAFLWWSAFVCLVLGIAFERVLRRLKST